MESRRIFFVAQLELGKVDKGNGRLLLCSEWKNPSDPDDGQNQQKTLEALIPVKPKGVDMIQEERWAIFVGNYLKQYGSVCVFFPEN